MSLSAHCHAEPCYADRGAPARVRGGVSGRHGALAVDRHWEIVQGVAPRTATWHGACSLGQGDVNLQDGNARLALADAYESYALYCFSRICFEHVRRKLSSNSAMMGDLSQLGIFERSSVEGVRKSAGHLFNNLQESLRTCVQMFVLVYTLQAFLAITLVTLQSECPRIDVRTGSPVLTTFFLLEPYLAGAAFLISFMAILNLVRFEHHQKVFLKELDPRQKFFSVKILVSIAFMQKGVLAVLGSMLSLSTTQVNLIYTCCVCVEVLPLSMWVWIAWHPGQAWYADDSAQLQQQRISEREVIFDVPGVFVAFEGQSGHRGSALGRQSPPAITFGT